MSLKRKSKTASSPRLPNVVISGVPATGKSTLAARLAAELPGFRVVDVGKESEARGLRDEYDEELETWVVDEDKLVTALEPDLSAGGLIIDWLHAEPFSDTDAVHLVITMHADNATLYDRYAARGYGAAKVEQNLDAAIMDEIGQENHDAFDDVDGVTLVDLRGDAESEIAQNVARVKSWVALWQKDQAGEDEEGGKARKK